MDARSSSSPSDDGEIVDLEVVETLKSLGGDEDPGLFAELVATFLADAPPRLDAIDQAVSAADPIALERAAHGLKSSAANMGLKRLAELCRQLEAGASIGSTEGSEALAARARSEFERAAPVLDSLAA